MQQGIHIAKARLLQNLAANASAFCTLQETSEALPAGAIAPPKLYVQGPEQEPSDVPGGTDADFPVVFLDGTAAPQRQSAQQQGGGRSFNVLYNLRLILWCRRDDTRAHAEVILDRDRLIAALTSALLNRSGWVVDDVLRVDVNSLGTEFGDVWEGPNGRAQAAGAITCTVRQAESSVRSALVEGDVTTVEIVVRPLAIGEAELPPEP